MIQEGRAGCSLAGAQDHSPDDRGVGPWSSDEAVSYDTGLHCSRDGSRTIDIASTTGTEEYLENYT